MSVEEIAEIRERAFVLCKEYLHGAWNNVASTDIEVKKVSGGLSNLLYLCSLPPDTSPCDSEPTRVLLRLYGQVRGETEEALEGLLTEAVIFTLLSESQRGPRLFGVFPGGRLEEYIPARPLLTRELSDPSLSARIASKLAQIHGMRVPINKHPRWLWDTMKRWLGNVEELQGSSNPTPPLSPPARVMLDKFIAYDLPGEVAWLRRELSTLGSPVVFCHNDLQEGNLLLRDATTTSNNKSSTREVVVIDFEYSAYNYRAFDFANHMCEWVYDYTCSEPPYFTKDEMAFPSQEQQEHFANAYLTALHHGGRDTTNGVEEHEVMNGTTREACPEEIRKLLRETRAFVLASHFFWALWSVVNGAVSTIPFDYWVSITLAKMTQVYGEARFAAYFKHKSHLISSGEVKP